MKRFSIYFVLILFTYPCVAFGQQTPSSTGEIYGTVYQVNPEQPVASAQVRIVETNQRITTDQNGEFRFSNLPTGRYTLTTSASGYQPPADVVVTIEPGETTELKIYLEQVTVELDEVEVTGERAASPVGRQTLSSSEIQRVPGSTGDALRALQALPSVGVANDFSGALYIRGGSDEKTTSTTLTESQSAIPTISVASSHLSVPKSSSGSMYTPAATVPNLASIRRR